MTIYDVSALILPDIMPWAFAVVFVWGIIIGVLGGILGRFFR